MKPVRVIIADNQQEYLDALQNFLGAQGDIQVVFVAHDGQGAVDACRELLPDVLLLELRLPVLDGVKATQAIVTSQMPTQVLSTSTIPQDHYAVEAVKAGARGYVKKNGPDSFYEIVDAIRQIAAGEVVLDADLAAHILEEFS
jgi:DNA-binding NarL/FixJ family response regulator